MRKWWGDADNRDWFWKVVFSVGLAIVVAVLTMTAADAAPVENDGGAANGIFIGDHMKLSDDSDAYYEIDTSEKTKEQLEQGLGENIVDTIKGASPFAIAKENGMAMMDMLVDFIFGLNQAMVNLMIGVLNFGFNSNVIDTFIDMVAGVVKDISGLSGVQIGGGLFGQFVMFGIVATAFVAAYQFVVRHSSITGLQTLAKSIAALAISFILIANFATIMKGMNDLTSWVSASALTGTTNFVTQDNRSTEDMMEGVNKNMWDLFIGKPYLVLQYGTDDIENIGEARINELLTLPPGEERDEYVETEEVGERNNTNMTVTNTMDRLGFSILYTSINALVSIPVYGVAILHIVFDFWFLFMAFLAPFVTIFSIFPGQFKVLERYAIELTYPLVLKVLVSFAMVFIFAIGFVAYSLPAAPGMPQYFTAAIFQFALFILLFVLRKRVKAIFAAGKAGPYDMLANNVNGLKHSINSMNSGAAKTARMGGHLVAGVLTGGASTSASTAIETVINLKKNNKGESPSKPIADAPATKTERPNASKPMAEGPKVAEPQKLDNDNLSKPFADVKEKNLDVQKDAERKERKTND